MRLRFSRLVVHLFLPHFFLPLNFLLTCLDTALCEQPASLAMNVCGLTLLVKGVTDCLLDNCQISSLPHDCVAECRGLQPFLHRGPVTVWKKSCRPGGVWMGSLKQVCSFILLSAHVEVDSSLVSERICAVNAALENSISFFTFTFCMTEVKTFTGITIAQSLHVDFVISIGSPSWFKTDVFPVLRRNRNPPCICIINAGIHGIKSVCCAV